jgi:hypothetical protein
VIHQLTCRNLLIGRDLDAAKEYTGCSPSGQSEENLYG